MAKRYLRHPLCARRLIFILPPALMRSCAATRKLFVSIARIVVRVRAEDSDAAAICRIGDFTSALGILIEALSTT